MIFVSIGSMFPFDRLVRLMDEIAPQLAGETCFAQIGDGAYEPRNMGFARMLSRREFMDKLKAARLLVAHAGMGSVISAMEVGTPVVLLPRRAQWGEVNTDHQLATARWLAGRPGLHVCLEDADLRATIESALKARAGGTEMAKSAPPEFIGRLRDFIAAS
jgi:UDP-N-acetylglucosamine transferase subunit ALG13